MTLRRLTGDDAAAWRALRLEALTLHPEAFVTRLAEAERRTLADDAARIDGSLTFGAFVGADLVGCLSVDREPGATDHRATINAVYVTAAHRGAGLAGALLARAKAEALDIGIIQLELFVAADNAGAIDFYTAAGFAEIGRIPRSVRIGNRFQDDLLMACALDAPEGTGAALDA